MFNSNENRQVIGLSPSSSDTLQSNNTALSACPPISGFQITETPVAPVPPIAAIAPIAPVAPVAAIAPIAAIAPVPPIAAIAPTDQKTMIRCEKSSSSWTSSSSSEHLIVIDVNGASHSFSIDKLEVPNISYAILMALTDVLLNYSDSLGRHIELSVNDLFVYNMFTKKSLAKWKNNNWISSTGKPIAYVDILSFLGKTIELQNLTFQTHWIRVTDQEKSDLPTNENSSAS